MCAVSSFSVLGGNTILGAIQLLNTLGLQVSHFWYSRYLLNDSREKQASFVIVTLG